MQTQHLERDAWKGSPQGECLQFNGQASFRVVNEKKDMLWSPDHTK